MRKLAKVVKIDNIIEHTNADALELAIIGGWQVVVKKGEYAANDLVIYCEVDSWIPHDIAPFLTKGEPKVFNGVTGNRLRTIKLRGELSQGLVLPISVLLFGDDDGEWEEGDDCSELLKIQKWEAPENPNLAGQAKGSFPSFIPKTDQERIQNIKSKIQQSFDDEEIFERTIKLDGSSMTVYCNNGEVGVCSRNQNLKINDENAENAFIKTAFKTGIGTALLSLYVHLGRNLAVQGELMGPGIQGNKENFTYHLFFIFDIFDIDTQRYLLPEERYKCLNDLEVFGYTGNHVPTLGTHKLETSQIDQLLLTAEGPSLFANQREGVVYKSTSRNFSFKAISNTWLLKNE